MFTKATSLKYQIKKLNINGCIIILMLLLISLFSNAQRRIIPFKNNYKQYPDTIISKFNYDDTWNNFVLLMKQNNFNSKLIDKNTGIITLQLDNAKITVEDKKGNFDTSAWAVTQKIYVVPRNKDYWLKQSPIIWYVRIKNNGHGAIVIIDSMKLETTKIYTANPLIPEESVKEYSTKNYSTGRFEGILKQNLE